MVRVRHNANSPKRVEIIVGALDEMDVPADVAQQLTAADPHFEVVDERPDRFSELMAEADSKDAQKTAQPKRGKKTGR